MAGSLRPFMLMKISLGERDAQKYHKKWGNLMLKPSFAMSKKTGLRDLSSLFGN